MYSLQDLATLSGVPARRIRYYRERRLLPPPRTTGGSGPHLHWGNEHLVALREIARIKDQRVTLRDLAERYADRAQN